MKIAQYKNTKYGNTLISEHDEWMEESSEYIRTTEFLNVEFIDKPKEEIVTAEIDALNVMKESVRAEMQVKLNAIDENIQSLLAISHEAVK